MRLILKIALLQSGNFHQRTQQANLQRTSAVNGNDQTFATIWHRKDVVTSVNSRQLPTVLLHDPGKIASRDLLQTATSITWSALCDLSEPFPANSQPSIASRMLERSSSFVSPCDIQPGNAGTSAQ